MRAKKHLIVLLIIVLAGLGAWVIWPQKSTADKEGTPKPAASSKAATQSASTQQHDNVQQNKKDQASFDCKGDFTISHPKEIQSTLTETKQCLIANTSADNFPPVGPVNPDQIGLFFTVRPTSFKNAQKYLDDYSKQPKRSHSLTIKDSKDFKLDNGNTAIMAEMYGGRPVAYDRYEFIYIKNGNVITTHYGKNTKHKQTIDTMLRTLD